MKKLVLPLFSILLVVAMLFSITSIAAATPPPPPPPPPTTPSLPEPTVIPVSGDTEFTTTFIPISQFPGTTEFNQMLVPVGFPAGEAQYQGDGVIVSGMDSGKATACFYITGTQYGWGGKVGVWNGTKWVLLATTIKALDESPNSLACATITGNGTYAFIRYVADASLLPVGKPSCAEIGVGWNIFLDDFNGSEGISYFSLQGFFTQNEDSWVSYRIINASTGVTGVLYDQVPSDSSGIFYFGPDTWFMPYGGHFTIHFETPKCYYDWEFDFSEDS